MNWNIASEKDFDQGSTQNYTKEKKSWNIAQNENVSNIKGKNTLSMIPHVFATAGGLLFKNTPIGRSVGLGLMGAGMVIQFANSIKEGKSISESFKSLVPLGAEALTIQSIKKGWKIINQIIGGNKKAGNFIKKAVELAESQLANKNNKKLEMLKQNDKALTELIEMSRDPEVLTGLSGVGDKAMQYAKKIPKLVDATKEAHKKAYNENLARLTENKNGELSESVLENFLNQLEETESLHKSDELKPAIENITDIVKKDNAIDIDLLRQAFQTNNSNQQPTRFPSVKPENFPLPKQLRTPYEEAIYNAIYPRLDNNEARSGMNYLNRKDLTLPDVLNQIQSNAKKGSTTEVAKQFLKIIIPYGK
jgi:hypothetical protein